MLKQWNESVHLCHFQRIVHKGNGQGLGFKAFLTSKCWALMALTHRLVVESKTLELPVLRLQQRRAVRGDSDKEVFSMPDLQTISSHASFFSELSACFSTCDKKKPVKRPRRRFRSPHTLKSATNQKRFSPLYPSQKNRE